MRLSFVLCLFLLSMPLHASAKTSDLLGLWQTTRGALINISHCGKSLCADLRSFNPPKGQRQQDVLDHHNHDTSKKTRKVLGLKVLWDILPTGANTWKAEGYDPSRGLEVSINLQLQPNGLLKMTGCKKFVLNFCENLNWQRP